MSGLLLRRKFSSPLLVDSLVNPFARQAWVRVSSALFFVLALLALQQVAMTHGYSHLGAASSEQVAARNDQPHSPATLHSCALCVVISGVNLLSPPVDIALPLAMSTLHNLIAAVSPAPTFSFPAAYLSRAPPVLLD